MSIEPFKECSCKQKRDVVRKGEFFRSFEVITAEGTFEVEYYGKAVGFEYIVVNDSVAHVEKRKFWFASFYEFRIGSLPAVLYVRVWPWLHVKSISLMVAEKVAYSEPNGARLAIRD